jgi:hypothetical protein
MTNQPRWQRLLRNILLKPHSTIDQSVGQFFSAKMLKLQTSPAISQAHS